MNATVSGADPVRAIPLDRLDLSPANVRRTDPGEAAAAELRASIQAHGLLENLVVVPDPATDERFLVVAGGRRLAALRELAASGSIAPDAPIPCLAIDAGADAGEISLAENTVRIAMHPADQVEAFALLARNGATGAQIAARFGVSERTVEQRLRLGDAAPALLEAYRAGEIDLETLKAFTVTADAARQQAAWDQVSQQGYRPSAWQIRRLLTEGRVPASAALAIFVGAEAYEAAGGQVDRDLFADQYEDGAWFADPALLEKLAADRLQAAADAIAGDWNWVEARPEISWTELGGYGRVHAVPADPTDEEKAEIDRLHTRHDELVNTDEEDWTAELEVEGEAIESRLAVIEAAVAARATWRDEDRAVAGCIVTVGNDGEVETVPGLVRADDIPARTPARTGTGAAAGAAPGRASEAGVIDPPRFASRSERADPAAEARKRAGVGIGLADDMRSIRTALVKAHLAGDFAAAFDLAAFDICRSVFGQGYVDSALDIAVRETPDRPGVRANDKDFPNPGEAMLADLSHLRLDWLAVEDSGEAFNLFRHLAESDRQALFAAAVARTLKGQLAFEHGARGETEATVARLDIPFETHVRPTADLYWSRINKSHAIRAAREVLGVEWAAGHSKDKKAVLADSMERAFAADGAPPAGVTADMRAAALAWTLPGFRAFDTAAIGDADAETGDSAATETAPETPSRDGRAGAEPAGGDVADAIDAMNAVPTADGGPRVIVATAGFEPREEAVGAAADEAGPEEDPLPDAPPVPDAVPPGIHANGHDGSGDAFDIPEFLRRT